MAMEIVTTADGSHTLFSPRTGEHYHSLSGALRESGHVYIGAGFNEIRHRDSVEVFEVGMGTGLNALLTWAAAEAGKPEVIYHAIEKYPVPRMLSRRLNYPAYVNPREKAGDFFRALHRVPWDMYVTLAPRFTLHKIKGDITAYEPSFQADLIYFDAFSPGRQPEIWSMPVFFMLHNCLRPGGILTTYSVKGTVKRMLREAGFRVERLQGTGAKREMLRAWKNAD